MKRIYLTQLNLKGDKTRNNTLYRISSASVASSAEELINLLLEKKGNDNYHSSTFTQKLDLLLDILKREDRNIDLGFLEKFNNYS